MKAMILAAGLGSRLRPLTETLPKALLPIYDKPLLFYVIQKLKQVGVNRLIINVHHHAEQIISYLKKNSYFGITIEVSHEDKLLDTGGGLKNASFFLNDGEPFFLHNVDVISSIDLTAMFNHHVEQENLVTLAVKKRKTSRYLLFDSQKELIGWKSVASNELELSRSFNGNPEEFSFLGIHVISPAIFDFFPNADSFSIIKAYLRMSAEMKSIGAFICNDDHWFDLGRKENIIPATEYLMSLHD